LYLEVHCDYIEAYLLFPAMYALLGGPLAVAGLAVSCLHWQLKPKSITPKFQITICHL